MSQQTKAPGRIDIGAGLEWRPWKEQDASGRGFPLGDIVSIEDNFKIIQDVTRTQAKLLGKYFAAAMNALSPAPVRSAEVEAALAWFDHLGVGQVTSESWLIVKTYIAQLEQAGGQGLDANLEDAKRNIDGARLFVNDNGAWDGQPHVGMRTNGPVRTHILIECNGSGLRVHNALHAICRVLGIDRLDRSAPASEASTKESQ